MSDGTKLLTIVLENGGVGALRDLPEDIFVDEEVVLHRFILRHLRRYGRLPALSTVESELDMRLPEAEETAAYYTKKVYDRRMYAQVRNRYTELQTCLRNFDMDLARDVIAEMRADTRIAHTGSDIRNIREASEGVLAEYQVAHDNPGVSGIPTLWPRYDNVTGGYQPGDLITYVARPEMGKTFTMLRHATAAYTQGSNVLIVTMEMTIHQIMRRMLGLLTGIDPGLIRKGTLSTHAHRRMAEYIESIRDIDRLHVFAGGKRKAVSDVEIFVQEYMPDIVFIDGVYFMNSENKRATTKSDRVSSVFDELKQMAIDNDVPVVGTTQYNRVAGKKGKDGSLENIAYSDAISTHSSIILSLQEGLPGRERSTRNAELIKGREGETGIFPYNYSFRPVNLDEIDETEDDAEAQDSEALDWIG